MAQSAGPRGHLISWLVSRALSTRDASRLLDALDDEYLAFQLPQRGRIRARLWYWRQVLTSVRDMRRQHRPHISEPGRHWAAMVDSLWRDVRLSARALRRSPAYAAASILTLALGIGATTSIFSVVQAVLLRPLPYEAPDRIVRAWAHADDGDITDFSFRVAEYRELAGRRGRLDVVGAEFPLSGAVVVPGQEPRQVAGRMVTPDFFRVFGTGPSRGRMFTADEIADGQIAVAVVTHGFWTRDLGADPEAVEGSIELNGRPYKVIGVLPSDYRHVSGDDAEFFVPYTIGTSGWIARWLDLYARLAPDATLPQAAAEIDAVMAGIARTDGRSAGWHATVEPIRAMVVGDVQPLVLATFVMASIVLLIACLNVANLTLARGTTRTPELALRVALGASSPSVVRSLLAESALLAVGGGLLGLALATAGVQFVRAAPVAIPRLADVQLDPAVVGFAAALVLVTALVCGLAPALRMVRYSTPDGVTLSGRATRRRGRFGGVLGGLIVVEVALALALLVGAGLMGRTFNNLVQEDFGFDRDAALTFAVTVPSARWPGADGTVRFYRQLRERLLEIPDVLAVGVGANLPLNGAGAVASVTTERRVEAGETNGITVLQRRAGVGFFEAMGTPIVAGRGFDERDRQDSPTVAVVSASLSRQLFPNEDPVGRRVAFGGTPGADDWMTVVGVVADMRYRDADHIDEPQIYQAHTQSTTREMNVVIRTLGRPLGVIEPARAVLAGLDARIPMDAPQPLHAVVDSALGDREFAMTTFGLFGGVALALTLAGIYGVIAFSAAQRRRELGVRLALGARRADVVRLMVNDGMWLVGGGLILGSAMALGGSNLLVSLLYGVEPIDSSVYGSVVLLLGTAGLAASYLPARLASQLDPLSVLRQD